MPCWPEALEALARYMVILLTVGCMPVPGDYVKVRVNPSDHPRLVRPSSPGQLPLLVSRNWKCCSCEPSHCVSSAALISSSEGLYAFAAPPRRGCQFGIAPRKIRQNFTSSDMMLLLYDFDRRGINVLSLSCDLWLL
jgi:hypothetical protein